MDFRRSENTAQASRILTAVLVLAPLAWGAPIQKTSFGNIGGKALDLYTLESDRLIVKITNYGGRLVEIRTPDKTHTAKNTWTNVTNGFDRGDEYAGDNPYFGALIGRYGNRIGHATFKLDGKTYTLPKNDGDNTLHGGKQGFDRKIWNASVDGSALVLTYTSPDGEEGFPGTLTATVRYRVTGNELHIDYSATTDKPTVLNLTNHAYFNLNGAGEGDILKHTVVINAERFTPIDSGLIPTGERKPVAGTPFDFRTAHAIGERIGAKDQQLQYGKGYDHNFVLNSSGGSLALAATVHSPDSGRVMEVLTTQPGLQFYTGNFLDGKIKGHGGKTYNFRSALCMETQHFPDSPNKPDFPSVTLRPGQKYQSSTVYRFSVR